MSWYKTGQIAVTNGSRVIVGVGTNFTRLVEVGEALLGPDGQHYEITSVPSATELRIGKDYAGPTAANQSYAIVPVQGYVRELAHKAADLIDAHRVAPAEALSYAESAEQSAAEAQAAKTGLQEARDASAASATQAAISASEAASAVAQVKDSASRAGASASQALSSAQSASASKADAEAAAVSAQNRAAAAAGNASSSASSASESAMSAAKSAASATEAANSAAAAAVSSEQALTRANAAGVSASESEQASLAANAAKTSAQDFANAAAESASSSSAAAVFAEGLSVQANQSASSAAASALLAQNAKSSAQAEAALAQAAKTDAQTASNSASANAVNAAASADAASQSELASGMSEIAAAASEAAAHSAKVAAELANAAAASSAAESASSASAARAGREEAAATVSVVTEARDAALAHTATAKAWADKLDGEVEPGKYSARYWAEITVGAVTGGVAYIGTWSAAGGVFPDGPSRGHLYKVSVAGEIDGVNYSVKDMIIFNGESWDKLDSTDEVTSVAGRVGAVLLTKVDVGLENVDNTADLDKPVSTAQRAALDQKQNNLVTGTSIKTVNGEDLLGSGDVVISKVTLGLDSVDNTSDVNKPISTAAQNALNAKEGTIAPGTTAQYWRGDKTWRDFFTDVRAATLTGLSTATNAVVAATDTVLSAIGKLQAQVSAKFDKTGGDVDGNINFTGAGRRITGDFSNATLANRTMFQTATPNGQTSIGVFPHGTNTNANINVFGDSDPANAPLVQLVNTGVEASLRSIATGSGNLLPLTFYTGDAERLRIDQTTGNVGIGTSAPESKFVVSNAGAQGLEIIPNTGQVWISSFNRATGSTAPLALVASALVFTAPSARFTGAFGYAASASGTVVQATSKATAVTLNKPSGRITMHNAALAASGIVTFTLNNGALVAGDGLHIEVDGSLTSAVNYNVWASTTNGGAFISLRNVSGGSLSEAVALTFRQIKGALS